MNDDIFIKDQDLGDDKNAVPVGTPQKDEQRSQAELDELNVININDDLTIEESDPTASPPKFEAMNTMMASIDPKTSPAMPPKTRPSSDSEPRPTPSAEKKPAIDLSRFTLKKSPELTPKVPVPPSPTAENEIRPLRTYESDVADVMSHKMPSVASMAMAEQKRATGKDGLRNNSAPTPSPAPVAPGTQVASGPVTHTIRNLIFSILSLILIGGGGYAAYYFYMASPISQKQPTQQTTPKPYVGLMNADARTFIAIDNNAPATVIAKVRAESGKQLPVGTIKELVFTEKDSSGSPTYVSGPKMLETMNLQPPDILKRSISALWMYGIYAEGDGSKSAFVIASEDFFQNSFAGMLQWEPVMADDLKMFLAIQAQPISTVPTIVSSTMAISTTSRSSTATSSASTSAITTNLQPFVPTYFAIKGHFEDRIILNKDVREFIGSDGKIVFLYCFVDNSRIVLTQSESALREIITRLEKQTFVR